MPKLEIRVPSYNDNMWRHFNGKIIEVDSDWPEHSNKSPDDYYRISVTPHNDALFTNLKFPQSWVNKHYGRESLYISRLYVMPINNREAVMRLLRRDD